MKTTEYTPTIILIIIFWPIILFILIHYTTYQLTYKVDGELHRWDEKAPHPYKPPRGFKWKEVYVRVFVWRAKLNTLRSWPYTVAAPSLWNWSGCGLALSDGLNVKAVSTLNAMPSPGLNALIWCPILLLLLRCGIGLVVGSLLVPCGMWMLLWCWMLQHRLGWVWCRSATLLLDYRM